MAIFLYLADRLGHPEVAPQARELVLSRTNDRRFAALIRREPRHLLLYSAPVVFAANAGALSPVTDQAMHDVLQGATPWSTERVPHRIMDLWNFCTAYQPGVTPPVRAEQVLDHGCLRFPPDPARATLRDAYAFTHNLLFLHNFGAGGEGFAQEPAPFALEDALAGLLIRFMAEDNCDIVAELVMVGLFQRQLDAWLASHAMEWIEGNADQSGFVTGPWPAASGADGAERAERDDHAEWVSNYHTTLVVGSLLRYVEQRGGLAALTHSGGGPVDGEELESLGQALAACSQYRLPLAAGLLSELTGSSVAQRFPQVFDRGVSFIRDQRNEDGTFGFWVDEEAIVELGGGSVEDFSRDLVLPVSQVCQAMLDGVERARHLSGASAGAPSDRAGRP